MKRTSGPPEITQWISAQRLGAFSDAVIAVIVTILVPALMSPRAGPLRRYRDQVLEDRKPSASALRTKSASERDSIFFIACPR